MNPADPLVLFMPSGKRGRFPLGTPVLDAARFRRSVKGICLITQPMIDKLEASPS